MGVGLNSFLLKIGILPPDGIGQGGFGLSRDLVSFRDTQ